VALSDTSSGLTSTEQGTLPLAGGFLERSVRRRSRPDDDAYDLWLDPVFQKTDAICDLLKPFDPTQMRRFAVSSRVNLVKNDDPICAKACVRS
jgi:hypothetical protein